MNWRVLTVILLFCGRQVFGQVVITGTVYDHSQKFTMTGVSVLSTAGTGTMTDSTGHYRLRLGAEDSIYFSYLGKSTLRFPAKEINANQSFDMALEVSIDSLPAAFVRGNNYLLDSLQTRKDYAKVFGYNNSYLSSVKRSGRGGMGVGFDIDLLFNAQENRRMEAFKDRLEWQEKENFVDHRFTKAIVRHVTGLEPPALDTFMKLYRPSQEFIQSCETTYEYYKYIRQWCGYFMDDWNQRHPDIAPRSKDWADSVTSQENHR
jgi:hypothetical protein